jgi:hypothetical protein
MKGGNMEFWATIKGFFESIKGYLPGAMILIVGLPIIYFGSRRTEEKPKNEKKKEKK